MTDCSKRNTCLSFSLVEERRRREERLDDSFISPTINNPCCNNFPWAVIFPSNPCNLPTFIISFADLGTMCITWTAFFKSSASFSNPAFTVYFSISFNNSWYFVILCTGLISKSPIPNLWPSFILNSCECIKNFLSVSMSFFNVSMSSFNVSMSFLSVSKKILNVSMRKDIRKNEKKYQIILQIKSRKKNSKNSYLKVSIIFGNNEFRLGFILAINDIHSKSTFIPFEQDSKPFRFFDTLLYLGKKWTVERGKKNECEKVGKGEKEKRIEIEKMKEKTKREKKKRRKKGKRISWILSSGKWLFSIFWPEANKFFLTHRFNKSNTLLQSHSLFSGQESEREKESEKEDRRENKNESRIKMERGGR